MSHGTLLLPRARKSVSNNDALYTDSTVALNADTGKLAWYYQHMNRDVWDLDWAFEQSLVTLPVHGKPTKLLVTGGKMAIFVGSPVSVGVVVNGVKLFCGLYMLTPLSDPLPLKAAGPMASELKPV